MRLAALSALVLSACIPSLDGIPIVDDAGAMDAGPMDAGPMDAGPMDAGPMDSGAPDAGSTDASTDAGADGSVPFVPSAIDVECDTVWAELSAPSGPCAGREVVTLAEPFWTLSLALSRTDDGTVLVAYNDSEDADIGRIATLTFDDDTPADVSLGPSIEPEAALGDVVGTDIALATERPDTHHIAYWLRSDFGNEVRYQTLRGGLLSPAYAIATGVGAWGVVDVEVDGDGRAVVAWHDDVEGRTAVRREGADGSFSLASGARMDGDPRIEGHGAVALARGTGATMHLAYQWCVSLAASAPSYNIGTGTTWSTARTLDNQVIADRTSGVGVDLTTVGDEVVVAYLDWTAGVGEIRFARFRGSEEPRIEIFVNDIHLADRPGDHPLVIEADAHGFLHLLVAESGFDTTPLRYYRETRVAGERRWIADTVADIATPASEVYVDMVLGPDRRPHIVYWDPTLGAIRYATARP